MKCIFCILLGIFLISGLNSVPDKEVQEFRAEAGTVEIQSYTESNYHVAEVVVKQSCEENNSVIDGMYNCKISDGVPGNSFLPRNFPLSKILRFNAASIAIQKLSSLKSQLPEVRWAGLSIHTNLSKYSYRNYIYTLECILI